MMPLANTTIINIFNAIKCAASFAAYTATIIFTGDASAATALRNYNRRLYGRFQL